MKPIYILKIGGSVATHKNKKGFSVRHSLMKKVAQSIIFAKKEKDFDLVLVHGAGGFGHTLAKEYELMDGTGNDKRKIEGALLSRNANQRLNNAITEIFVSEGLPITSVHTASVIINNNKKIVDFNMLTVKESLKKNCIPILYGDMVFDKKLGMTICSGDAIVPYLADKLKIKKMFFASDIEGVFTKDPYLHNDAELVENISLKNIKKNIKLSESHNADATGGLLGKIKKISILCGKGSKSVEIFNGLSEKNYEKILLGKNFPHTRIIL